MPAPMDYRLNIQNPAQALTEGLRLGAGIADLRRQQMTDEQTRIAMEQAQAMRNDLSSLASQSTASAADYARMITKYPQLSEQLKRGWETYESGQQQARLNQGAEVFAALQAGKPDIAQELLKTQAEAYLNSGDKETSEALERAAQLVELNPDAAQTTIGLMLASTMGPDKFTETFTKLQEERRTALEAPGALEKQAADLGLTKAETNKVLAETSKLNAEARKAALELEALQKTGGLDPDKKFTQEEKLRKEYKDRTKLYDEAQAVYQNLLSSAEQKTGPGDIALVTSFMKMLDPGSVVRETEFATARNTGGLFDRLMNQAESLQSGRLFSLDSKQRSEYIALAKKYFDAAQKKAGTERASLNKVVENYKLNPDNVFGVPAEEVKSQEPETVNVGGIAYTRPPDFTDEQWNAYKRDMGVQ